MKALFTERDITISNPIAEPSDSPVSKYAHLADIYDPDEGVYQPRRANRVFDDGAQMRPRKRK